MDKTTHTAQSPDQPAPKPKAGHRFKALRTAVKVTLWTAMSVILIILGTMICGVRILSAEHLTRIVEDVANRKLNGELTIGQMELSMRSTFPYLRLDIDDLTLVSHSLDGLSADDRASLPAYSDTLLTLKHFSGSINVAELLRKNIKLRDVIFTSPGANIVVAREGLNNFNVYDGSTEEADTTSHMKLPPIEINRFSILHPKDFRFYDAVSGSWGTLAFHEIELEGIDAPTYTLDFNGNFFSSWLSAINLRALPFAIDGNLRWDPEQPDLIGLNDFRINLAFFSMNLDTEVDFGRDLVINSADVTLDPVRIADIWGLIPDTMLISWGLTEKLATEAAISLRANLARPFNTSTDTIPYGTLEIEIPDNSISYGKIQLNQFGLNLKVDAQGNDPDSTVVTLQRLRAAGPMTDLTLKGTATELTDDPLIRGCLKGTANLKRMPRQLANLMQGYVSGRLDADIDFDLRPSMFSRTSFHRLKLTGDIDGKDLYWLSDDTTSMVYATDACLKFGTNERMKNKEGRRIDSLLTATLQIDSINVLHTEYEFNAKGFRLGIGASNRQRSSDTTAVVPMGGGLSVEKLNFKLLTDTMVVRAREVKGRVAMKRYQGETTRPEFVFDLNMRRLSTGNPSTRLMISGAEIHLDAHKLPPTPGRERVKQMADSIARVHPDIAPDSVMKMAYEKYASSNRPHGRKRVTEQMRSDSLEIIDWGTSKMLRRILLDWEFKGSMTARRASLFTHYFPIRNRVRNINLAFNNDSITFHEIAMKAGHSDALMSGNVSNLKRGLTSKRHRQSIKLNFDVLSDTIDVNQLAALIFSGGAYRNGSISANQVDHDLDRSDDEAESVIEDMFTNVPDTAGPVLIPVNVEAEFNMKANNVFYSDLSLHDLRGQALLYDGALNLHRLHAQSDIGSVDLSALYSAPSVDDMKFGFGLLVKNFYIDRFLNLVPAIDSVMPLLRDISGVINADLAATVDIDPHMDFRMNTLSAAVKLQGDSLVLIDPETFRLVSKWLMFKDKNRNVINHMEVEMIVKDNMMRIYPFVFDFDRYRLGVQGYNNLQMDFDYHIAVLKSPIPFKFGINVSGNPDKYKIRLGGPKFNEHTALERVAAVDTTRVNLLNQLEGVFRRGVRNSDFARLNVGNKPVAAEIDLSADTLTAADSLLFIKEGLLPAPPADTTATPQKPQSTKRNRKRK